MCALSWLLNGPWHFPRQPRLDTSTGRWTLPERDVCEDCPRSICLSLPVLCLFGLPTGLWALSHRTLAPYRSMIQVEPEVFLHAVVTRYGVLGLWYIHSAISWRNVFSSPYLTRRLLSSRLPPRCLSLVQSSPCVRHGVPPRLAHILQHGGFHLREAILLLRSVLHVGSSRLEGAVKCAEALRLVQAGR